MSGKYSLIIIRTSGPLFVRTAVTALARTWLRMSRTSELGLNAWAQKPAILMGVRGVTDFGP